MTKTIDETNDDATAEIDAIKDNPEANALQVYFTHGKILVRHNLLGTLKDDGQLAIDDIIMSWGRILAAVAESVSTTLAANMQADDADADRALLQVQLMSDIMSSANEYADDEGCMTRDDQIREVAERVHVLHELVGKLTEEDLVSDLVDIEQDLFDIADDGDDENEDEDNPESGGTKTKCSDLKN